MQRAVIRVSERIELPAPPPFVWDVLENAETVAGCIRGAQLYEQKHDGTFAGKISITLGPTAVGGRPLIADDIPRFVSEMQMFASGEVAGT